MYADPAAIFGRRGLDAEQEARGSENALQPHPDARIEILLRAAGAIEAEDRVDILVVDGRR